MSFQILRVLDPPEIQAVVGGLASRKFADGKLTAAGLARDVKNNLQVERTGPEKTDLDEIVFAALRRNSVFQDFVIPKRLAMPHYSRYEPGMQYGAHVDGAVMGSGTANPMRTDLAMTIFLAPASSYDGGELVIELPVGEQEIKLEAGEAVVYQAGTMHRVNPVTRGVRLAVVTWIQSAVTDERIREILFELNKVNQAADNLSQESRALLAKAYNNLLRLHIDL